GCGGWSASKHLQAPSCGGVTSSSRAAEAEAHGRVFAPSDRREPAAMVAVHRAPAGLCESLDRGTAAPAAQGDDRPSRGSGVAGQDKLDPRCFTETPLPVFCEAGRPAAGPTPRAL